MSTNCSCGIVIPDGSQFCPNCGKPIGQSSGQPTEQSIWQSGANQQSMPVSSGGLSQNAAAGLSYFTFIPAMIFLMMEPYNRNSFIRFHAWQSIFLSIASIVTAFVLAILFHLLGFLGLLLLPISPIVDIVFFAAWLFCVIKAFSNQMFKLPFIGDLAAQQAGN